MITGKKPGKNKAIFIDRDGVINENPALHDYVKNWAEFEWLLGAQEAIKALKKLKWLVIVVSNQRGVARRMMTLEDVEGIHRHIQEDLSQIGAKIDAFYFCPHNYDDNCSCRKPKTGLIKKAEKDFNLDVNRSFVVGDAKSDIEMGQRAGCKTILVLTGEMKDEKEKEIEEWDVKPNFIAQDLKEAVSIIGG